eukprot:78452_1
MKHILFIIKNNFAETLVTLLKNLNENIFEKITNKDYEANDMLDIMKGMVFLFAVHLSALIYIQCQRHNEMDVWNNFVLKQRILLHKILRDYKSRNGTKYELFKLVVSQYKNALMKIVDGKKSRFNIAKKSRINIVKKCGWNKCNKESNTQSLEIKSHKMYICKGCKLIYYCCRKHQKKDWKMIHSQQCLKMR